jgi:hypothetical protein
MAITTPPTINLNGSDPKELLKSLKEAYRAIRKVQESFQATAPHGRDYQTAEPGAFQKARSEWGAHQDALRASADYLIDVAEQVQDQIDQRRRGRQSSYDRRPVEAAKKDKQLTIREVSDMVQRSGKSVTEFWQEAAGGDMVPLSASDVKRILKQM